MYELAPNKSLLPALADIYLKMQNFDKYLDYGKKVLAEFPLDQVFQTAIQMAQVYIQKQDVPAATDLFSKVMDIYGDKVPTGIQEAQWNATRAFAYGVIATGIYTKKDYPKAQELYEKVIKFDPKRDDAYYYVGMCKWRNNDSEGAIEPFAKCIALNKATAKKAQEYLEQIYKARHNNSLDGLDKILAKAKADLGIS
jgi:tetratricopeptide (TPR) repeat protein